MKLRRHESKIRFLERIGRNKKLLRLTPRHAKNNPLFPRIITISLESKVRTEIHQKFIKQKSRSALECGPTVYCVTVFTFRTNVAHGNEFLYRVFHLHIQIRFTSNLLSMGQVGHQHQPLTISPSS